MTCMDALMPRAQDAQERPLAGRSASMKPNFARNTAIPKLMTVSLGGLHAIPGAVAEFFFGPSPAIPGGSFAQHEASLQNCWAHPTLTWRNPTLPSALSGFTSEFEMGSGGTHSLLSSGNSVAKMGSEQNYFTYL